MLEQTPSTGIARLKALTQDLLTGEESVFQKIHKAKSEYEDAFDALPDLMFITDPEDRIIRVNQALVDKLNTTYEEVVGKKCCEVIHGCSEKPYYCPHKKLQELNGSGVAKEELTFEKKLNFWVLITVAPIRDTTGKVKAYIHSIKNLTEQMKNFVP